MRAHHLLLLTLIGCATSPSGTPAPAAVELQCLGAHNLEASPIARTAVASTDWELRFPLCGYVQTASKYAPDERFVRHQFNLQRFNISTHIQKTDACSSAATCLAMFLAKPSPVGQRENVQPVNADPYAAVTYAHTLQHKGQTFRQININGHSYRDGYWIDVHISIIAPEPNEELYLKPLLQRVIIGDKPTTPYTATFGHLKVKAEIHLTLPAGWVAMPMANRPLSVKAINKQGDVLLITPMPVRAPEGKKGLKLGMLKHLMKFRQQSVEGEALDFEELTELDAVQFTATDPNIKEGAKTPGNFRIATFGSTRLGEQLCVYTILSQTKDAPAQKVAHTILGSVKIKAP